MASPTLAKYKKIIVEHSSRVDLTSKIVTKSQLEKVNSLEEIARNSLLFALATDGQVIKFNDHILKISDVEGRKSVIKELKDNLLSDKFYHTLGEIAAFNYMKVRVGGSEYKFLKANNEGFDFEFKDKGGNEVGCSVKNFASSYPYFKIVRQAIHCLFLEGAIEPKYFSFNIQSEENVKYIKMTSGSSYQDQLFNSAIQQLREFGLCEDKTVLRLRCGDPLRICCEMILGKVEVYDKQSDTPIVAVGGAVGWLNEKNDFLFLKPMFVFILNELSKFIEKLNKRKSNYNSHVLSIIIDNGLFEEMRLEDQERVDQFEKFVNSKLLPGGDLQLQIIF